MGQAEKARDNLDRALALLPESEPTPERAMILELKARFLLLQGRFAESRDAADEALSAAEAAGVEGTEALILNRLGLSLFHLGEEERGDEVMRKSMALARRSGSNDQLATAFVNYAGALHHSGRSEEAAELTAQAAKEVTPGDRSALWIACARSEIAFDLGDWDEAEAAAAGAQRAEWLDPLQPDAAAGRPELGRGDAAGARKSLEHARDLLADSVEPQYIAPAGELAVELELRDGDIAAARAAAAKAIDQLEFCSDDAARMAQISAAATMVEAEAAERARDLGDADELAAAVARAELAAARTAAAAEEIGRKIECAYALDGEADLARARRDADAPARAAAAAAAWDDLRRPYLAARARRREAEAFAAAGEREAAAGAAAQALAAAEELGSEWLAREIAGLHRPGATAATSAPPRSGGNGGRGTRPGATARPPPRPKTTTPSASPRASARSWRRWPKARPTARSPPSSTWRRRPPASTSPGSSPSWASAAAPRRPRSPIAWRSPSRTNSRPSPAGTRGRRGRGGGRRRRPAGRACRRCWRRASRPRRG